MFYSVKFFIKKGRGFKSLFAGNVISAIFGFLNVFLLAKNLGLSGYGELVLYQSLGLIVVAFFNLKLWEPILQELGMGEGRRKEEVIKSGFYIETLFSLSGAAFAMVLGYLGSFFYNYDARVVFFVVAAIPFMCVSTQNGLIRQDGIYYIYILACFFSGILRSLVIFLYVDGMINAVAAYLATEVVKYVILTIPVIKLLSKRRVCFNLDLSRSMIKKALRLNISSVLDIPVNHLDKFLVGHYLGLEITGVYAISKRVGGLYSIVINSLYQHSYKVIIRKGVGEYGEVFRWIALCIIFSLFSAVMLYFVLASGLVSGFIPNEMVGSYFYICSIFLSVGVSISFIFLHPVFLAAGGYIKIIKYTFISNVIYLVALHFLVNLIGVMGIPISIVLQSVVLFYMKWRYVNHENKFFYENKV